jgi:hypothetical protein
MGYRLHYAKKYQVEWDGGYFNWQTDAFSKFVADKFSDSGWFSEDEASAELDKVDIEAYIEALEKLKPERNNKYFSGYTNVQVWQVFTEILNNSDPDNESVRLEWY